MPAPGRDAEGTDDPEVVAEAPGRVVLVGDHTDHAGGVSLTMAIDRSTTVAGTPGGKRIVLRSTSVPGAVELDLGNRPDPTRPLPDWGRLAAAVADEARPALGLAGEITSTVPVGSGLASSAAFELALALGLGFEGSPLELARLGQRAEQRALGVPCGLLDQLTAASGVEGHALLLDLSDDSVEPIAMPEGVDVVVVHSGETRTLAGSAYAERRAQCEAAAALVGPLPAATPAEVGAIGDSVLRRRARHVASECRRVRDAGRALADADVAGFGALMVESHRSLRDDFEVSTPTLDQLVERLTATPGVLGARLTGAGFGGCVVALCETGAVGDPTAWTGTGWTVRPAQGATVRRRSAGTS